MEEYILSGLPRCNQLSCPASNIHSFSKHSLLDRLPMWACNRGVAFRCKENRRYVYRRRTNRI